MYAQEILEAARGAGSPAKLLIRLGSLHPFPSSSRTSFVTVCLVLGAHPHGDLQDVLGARDPLLQARGARRGLAHGQSRSSVRLSLLDADHPRRLVFL